MVDDWQLFDSSRGVGRRGQAAITDLFIAVAVFIVLVTIVTLIWNLYNARLESRLDYDHMVLKAYAITDMLVKSQGYPEHWEAAPPPQLLTATSVIGLAEYDRVLSDAKLKEFARMSQSFGGQGNYSNVTQMFKLGSYDYYFVLRNQTATPVYTGGKIPQGKFTVNLARLVTYQGQPYIFEFAVWRY